MGSFYRDIEHLAAEHVGSTDTAGDHSGSRAIGTGVSTLRAAKPKLHDSVPACGEDDTGCFGRDQALVVDDI